MPPRASKGVQKNMLILLPVDTAATAMEPRELTAACKITLPMAVMEYWSPMGMPMAQSTRIMSLSGFFSSPSILRTGNLWIMYARHRTAEIPWETTVARAGPPTLIWSTRIVKKSRPMFNTEDRRRKYTGVLLSPRLRMIPARRLYI